MLIRKFITMFPKTCTHASNVLHTLGDITEEMAKSTEAATEDKEFMAEVDTVDVILYGYFIRCKEFVEQIQADAKLDLQPAMKRLASKWDKLGSNPKIQKGQKVFQKKSVELRTYSWQFKREAEKLAEDVFADFINK